MSLIKATRLEEVYRAFNGRPVAIEDIDKFYLDTEEARGDNNPRRRIARTLRANQTENLHFLLVGYKGCGKSTELNHLERDIQDQFLVLNYSVQDELDPVHLNYIELFIVTMEQLFTAAVQYDLPLNKEYLTRIQGWISSKEIEEIREKYNIGIDGEAGAEGSLGIPFLQKFFYKFKVSAKSSRSLKEVLKTNIEPKLSDLIDHCNDLITEVRLKLNRIGKRDLLIIVEDLDKIPLDRAQDLFLNYTNQLTQLKANVIFTFPIALYHSRRFNEIKSYFNDVHELPMVNVTNPDGSENPEAISTLQDIVERRMDVAALFANPAILKKMIMYCGGVLRDLFLLIRESAENALDYERKAITEKDFERSYQKMKKEYANNIAEDTEGSNRISVEEYYKVLVALVKSPTKQLDNSDAAMHLRQNLTILGYDGEGWCDVHPIVKDILKERGKL